MSEGGADGSVLSGPIGPYEILEEIGKGTSGITFRGRHTGLGRSVAIKLLNPMLVGRGNSSERFRREARMLASLDHPNVVAIHDCGEHEGKLYMVLELVEGSDVRGMLEERGGALPLETCYRLMRELLLGLEAAHAKGIVHRDIKPDNLLITEHGTLKIADFGAGRVPDFEPITRVGALVGTPYYMAPEQCAVPGWSSDVDARTDLYAVGVVFFEMLTGKLPFRSRSLVELIQKKISEPPPDLSSLRSDAPKSYSRLARKLLAARPEDRYQSAREALEELISPESATLTDPALSPSEGRATKRISPAKLQAALRAAGEAKPERLARDAELSAGESLRLILRSEDKGDFEVALSQGAPVSLGRSSQRATLAVPDQRMSRRHCELRLEGGEVWIKDLGSANGTYVNGRRIPVETVISDGDRLIVGDTKLTIAFAGGDAAPPDVSALLCSRCGGPVRPGSIVDGRAVVVKGQALLVCGSCALNAPLEERLKAEGFIIEELLSSAGPSLTYRARRSSVDELVTLRVFDLEGEADLELGRRFRKDARALARLRHPCSVPVYDVRKSPTMIYAVMEFTVGEDLSDRVVRRGRLPLPEALQIIFNAARVCELAESQGLVHQNLNPESIRVAADGRTKLTSFALGGPPAREQRDSPWTRFLAPEVLQGGGSADRVLADIYSLGACLYYAITGAHPFADMGDDEYLRRVRSRRLPSFKPTIEGAKDHPWLETFMERCLEIDPRARHDSMSKLVAELVSVVKREFLPDYSGSGESLFALLNSNLSGTATSRIASSKNRTKGLIAGTFEGDELAEFLQMVGLNQRDGCLEIVSAKIRGEIYIEGGALVGGQAGGDVGLLVAKRLMKTEEGTFEFRSELPEGARQFEPVTVSSFLLDIMRESDERDRT